MRISDWSSDVCSSDLPQCRERQICNGLRLSLRVEDSNARAAVARQRVGSAGRARDCGGCGESKPIEKAEQSTAKPLLAAEQVGRTGEVEPWPPAARNAG